MASLNIGIKETLNVNSISLAGEFFTLGQLALRGFDANMTLGHTKSVDILLSAPKGKLSRLRYYSICIKNSLVLLCRY